MLEAAFRDIEKKYFSTELTGGMKEISSDQTVSAVAALCFALVGIRPQLHGQLLNWLSKGQGGSIQTIGLRRALMAMLVCCGGRSDFIDVLESLLTQWQTLFKRYSSRVLSSQATNSILNMR